MRTLSGKTTAAVLRKTVGKKDWEWAQMLGLSVQVVHNIEAGRTKLTHDLATKLFHETGISRIWLLNEDETAPPIAESGEPYTPEIYDRAQAQKIPYDQPHPAFRNFDKLGFCARLIAILESASSRQDYYMALYKVHTALDSLQREFGIDEKVYQHSGPHQVNNSMAIAALKEILARDKEMQRVIKQLHRPTPKPTKKQPSKKRKR